MEGIQYNKSNVCFPILAENQLAGYRFYGRFQYLGGEEGGRAGKLCSARCIVRGSKTLCRRLLHCAVKVKACLHFKHCMYCVCPCQKL